jgi:hypothetical protein
VGLNVDGPALAQTAATERRWSWCATDRSSSFVLAFAVTWAV